MLPAICAGVLALLAAAQFALTGDVELPPAGWAGGGARTSMPQIAGSFVPQLLHQKTIFSPERTAGAATGSATPLGGGAVAGSITIKGRSYAVVQRPDGRTINLPIGGSFSGMRLVAVSNEGAVFAAAEKRIQVPYGRAVTAPAEPEISEEEQE